MSYSLIRKLVDLTEEFGRQVQPSESDELEAFSRWLSNRTKESDDSRPFWEGKDQGRSAESLINTLIVRLYRYAKIYSKAAIANSPFNTLDDVVFLINILHSGSMTKIELIEKNVLEKSTGIQIINRLLNKGFVAESVNPDDRRSKKIHITDSGRSELEKVMGSIRKASSIVVGDLVNREKNELIILLQKLEQFHQRSVKEISQSL